MPIKYKLALVLGILLGFMWAVVFLNLFQLHSFTTESGRVMDRYARITDFINAFSNESVLMETYVRPSHTDRDAEAFFEAVKQTDACLLAIAPDLEEDLHEEYMLKRAISNAMERYRKDRKTLMETSEYSENIRRLVTMRTQAAYISQYSSELLRSAMRSGESAWDVIAAENRARGRLIVGFMIAATAATIAGLLLLIRTILRPLENISLAADAISEQNYDYPPLPEHGKDEIGRTARSFNLMQAQIRRTIRAMEQEAEIEKENARIQKALQESRYAELQNQINPHFLFNSLNAIAALASEEGAPIAEELIGRLAKILRYSLESSKKTVTLERELEYLKDYMELMDARFAGRITMDIEPFDEALLERAVPKFILQILAENSIIHGFRDINEGAEICVKIGTNEAGWLKIVMSDNGCGFDASSLKEDPNHHSIGLANIRERLSYIGGIMEIDSRIGEGTDITVLIDKDYQNDQDIGS